MPCMVFRNALLCSTAARQSATTMEAAAALRRSRRSVVRCGQGDANATARNDRESRMPLASNAADRTSWVNGGTTRRVLEPSKNSRFDGAVVEPALYTVEGRQIGDLRQKCGSALIRKAKLPA
jgi:hypothetical protein